MDGYTLLNYNWQIHENKKPNTNVYIIVEVLTVWSDIYIYSMFVKLHIYLLLLSGF